MDIHPEMRELREFLDTNGVRYLVNDDVYATNLEGDQVPADDPNYWHELFGITHTERTRFVAPDGRYFDVGYLWVLDDDGQKVFCSKYGELGYLEVRVGIDEPYAAYADEIIEAAFGYCR